MRLGHLSRTPHVYAYNAHVHRTTNCYSFELALLRCLTEASLLAESSQTDALAASKSALLTEAVALRAMASAYIDKRKSQYKSYHDKGLRHRPAFTTGGKGFIKQPPSTAATLAEEVEDMSRSKLGPR